MAFEVKFSHYGELRDVNATDGELEMFEELRRVLSDAGFDSSILGLVRKSDNYVTAAIYSEKYEWMDVCRFKYTQRTKWIVFPYYGTDKNRISSPSDLKQFQEQIVTCYNDTIRYL